MQYDGIGRRAFLAGAVAVSTAALTAQAQEPGEVSGSVRRNMSSFRALDWHPYFADTRNGAILVDTTSRALHFWSEDQTIYKLYPTSVPLSEERTRRGRAEVVKKVVGPEWRPTPSMKERNPRMAGLHPAGPRQIRWGRTRCRGSTTESTGPTTPARSAAALRTAASASTTSTSPSCSG